MIQDSPEAKQDNDAAVTQAQRRTAGNKLFDWIVYPTIAFGAVFAFSIAMLHTTKFGHGPLRQKYDHWVKKTEGWFGRSLFKGKDAAELHKKADNYLSVLVSFFAGTLIITPIKLFEDKRMQISKFFDRVLGTTPDDPAAYAQEPKQGWKSVLGGRTFTFGVVLTLATLAGKFIIGGAEKVANKVSGMNATASNAQNASRMWKWSYVSAFEGFYTALCAVMVYFTSRAFARIINKKEGRSLAKSVASAVDEYDTGAQKVKYYPDEPAAGKKTSPWAGKNGAAPSADHVSGIEGSRAATTQSVSI